MTIQNGVVMLDDGPQQGRVVRSANNTRAIRTGPAALPELQHSTLDVLTVDTSIIVNSNGTVALYQGADGQGKYYAADSQTVYTPFIVKHWNYSTGQGYRGQSWLDPTADVIWTFNQFMFRAGVRRSRA